MTEKSYVPAPGLGGFLGGLLADPIMLILIIVVILVLFGDGFLGF